MTWPPVAPWRAHRTRRRSISASCLPAQRHTRWCTDRYPASLERPPWCLARYSHRRATHRLEVGLSSATPMEPLVLPPTAGQPRIPPARRHHSGSHTAQARLRGGVHLLRGSGQARRVNPGRGDITCLPGAESRPRSTSSTRCAPPARWCRSCRRAGWHWGSTQGGETAWAAAEYFAGSRAGHRSARRRGAGSQPRHVWTGTAGRNPRHRPPTRRICTRCDQGLAAVDKSINPNDYLHGV